METTVDEIADGIYRLSTFVPDVAPPAGFTFNQMLIKADEQFLLLVLPADSPRACSLCWPWIARPGHEERPWLSRRLGSPVCCGSCVQRPR